MGHAAYPLYGTIPAEPIVHRLWERGQTARELAVRFGVPLPSMMRYLRLRMHKWEESQRRAPAPDTRKIIHTVRSFERSAYHVMHVSLPRISMHVKAIEGRKDADWRVAA
ncbi:MULTISPECIES: hypothetical protein [unclassified Ensifer]|uniref:hypothetical protein n=1 Tax=unclassified Ensifer TaxID=2633371 RepID=UPI00070B781B|nr:MULTISPECIES: hypothetical protein [unclassified Ensifer]KQW62883.1 hypothetical protein ASD02_01825 [Ensifer sp. Root1252]KRC83704.1 hypothetical protein ASE32_01815 [Ensifer sp. Root231]KRD04057.1 hypothetical protein ASE47_00475 [Ensifer sp. Root258]